MLAEQWSLNDDNAVAPTPRRRAHQSRYPVRLRTSLRTRMGLPEYGGVNSTSISSPSPSSAPINRHMPPSLISMPDRKSTRLNSSHLGISYAVFCLKKK